MIKIIKKFSTLALCLLLVACNNGGSTTTSESESSDHKTIGAIQFVEHPALDSATEGFKAALADNGFVEGENLTIDYHNAQADQSNCETIANKFVNANVDLIFANATPAAQAVAAKTDDIPIIVTSVTDPKSAGLVKSNELPETNVSGTSDLTPVKEQIDLLLQILPETKTIGVMYTGSEENSIFQANIAKEYIDSLGLDYLEATVSDSNAIQQVTESIIGKVDALYIPTDNLLAEGMVNVTQITHANNLPTIVGEIGVVENGGLATYGINYYNLGYLAGEMAAKVLNGEDVSKMPIGYLPAEECELSINKTAMEQLGITIDEEILSKAIIVE
ncbi:MAG: ABC transporter substrate-binding protein [Erysipelotrichaceae bacterium]|nr:ABC transporter substrate-binding protein [Erysipelotrichaceae bacterium]